MAPGRAAARGGGASTPTIPPPTAVTPLAAVRATVAAVPTTALAAPSTIPKAAVSFSLAVACSVACSSLPKPPVTVAKPLATPWSIRCAKVLAFTRLIPRFGAPGPPPPSAPPAPPSPPSVPRFCMNCGKGMWMPAEVPEAWPRSS